MAEPTQARLIEAVTQAIEWDQRLQMRAVPMIHLRRIGIGVKVLDECRSILDAVIRIAVTLADFGIDVEAGEFLFSENEFFTRGLVAVKWVAPPRRANPMEVP